MNEDEVTVKIDGQDVPVDDVAHIIGQPLADAIKNAPKLEGTVRFKITSVKNI